MRASAFFSRLALLCCGALLLLLPGCIDPYMPDGLSGPPNYLVVDGFLNSQGVTSIKLSRTYAIDARTAPPVEARASVAIEQEAGPRIPLLEAPAGTYKSPPLQLNSASRYRLHILTADGKEYASDYTPVKNTPPIDSVTWKTSADGLRIYVNSHDDANNTQYYRWDYDETWEIVPVIFPQYEYHVDDIRLIAVPYPTLCWGSTSSSAIRLTKTVGLSQDRVANFQLQSYPPTSERLRHKYSILVKQYAQTKEEYQYWELLRKNTESIGGLFDPLPSQLTGNIQCLNDSQEKALGYIGAYSVQEKRIFISRIELPRQWPYITGYENCLPPDTVELKNIHVTFRTKTTVPIEPVFSAMGPLRGYSSTSIECADCRKRGTAVRPSFWQ
ncbi:DUF4249 domain-containing protein [Microvirga sp. STR05]|uniref:DUF4249 domain-containing protein n=1 Tax=Hymenobacter duratus TaxID=2771356 RepID=A0ABR8JDC2_9BACT|nr:DUF4249 domain-containing protein [Hymenobacter duratus]MBD2713750.1 DUF4249 domain-containing protein [Hymenobacter duratus]MBR7948652.1 DUF4249 domain-containing protein [Microvirga sp. STR05]